MRHVSRDERRTRMGARHHLADTVDTVEEAAAAVVGLHASDPATVYLSARARVGGFTTSDLERALYDGRSLVRLWGMRQTLFVTTRRLAAIMHAASPEAFGAAERRRFERLLTEQDKAQDARAWIDHVESEVIEELTARGEATANDLRKVIPELRETLTFGEGKSWGGTVGVSTRILFMLAAQGRIVRGRPLGSWVSSQYRWALTSQWLGAPLADMEPAAARAELVRCWLRQFGPGTMTDIKWWTGWTVRDTRAALAMLDVVEVDLDGSPGWLLADDLDPVEPVSDWVALLPGLDSTVMGWKERDWYFGEHTPALFDRNGNAGPTVWWNGRVVGGWAQRENGEVAFRLLSDIPGETKGAIETEAQRLREWLGPVRLIPRFRTPLERELTG
ncbi:MAG: winged helix DNA-binding domain-containing protein [Acidimicrobiia bacterium]